MKLTRVFLLLLAGCAALVHAQAQAADTAPDVLVKNVTDEVLQIIRSDKGIQAGNNQKAIALIEAKVLPHFNFAHMTQLAVGHDWKAASGAQQKQLADEFHALLVRTYAKALTEYKNSSIKFKPFKMGSGEGDVEVRTDVMQAGGKSISLDYFLEKLPTGWTVFDIEVDGISLVTNYRNSFAAEVRSGGIDGLIKSLHSKNGSGAESGQK